MLDLDQLLVKFRFIQAKCLRVAMCFKTIARNYRHPYLYV